MEVPLRMLHGLHPLTPRNDGQTLWERIKTRAGLGSCRSGSR